MPHILENEYNLWHDSFGSDGICRTLTTTSNGLSHRGGRMVIKKDDTFNNFKIRKLTPKECFRLMGFIDTEFDKIGGGISNTQLYKQAGNSIVVNVLTHILDKLNQKYDMDNCNLLSLFSGIGAFESAFNRLGLDYNLLNYCEIDKYASKSYSLIHEVSEDKNLWDITKVNEKKLPHNIDLLTYGFPCTDISIAGKQEGFFNDSGEKTRSGLFFDALRIIEETQPKICICENVKALTSKKFEKEFIAVLEGLDNAGYNNYYQILNAKDYGIPQNRERVFIISIRKDIDKGYEFPLPIELDIVMKDLLEKEVEDKYYIYTDRAKTLIKTLQETGRLDEELEREKEYTCDLSINKPKLRDIANCITARTDSGIQNQVSLNNGVVEKVSKSY